MSFKYLRQNGLRITPSQTKSVDRTRQTLSDYSLLIACRKKKMLKSGSGIALAEQ